MLQFLSLALDLVPILLAIVAIIVLRDCTNTLETKLARACVILLIICQSTWIHSYLVNFSLLNLLVDRLWTIFNSLVMLLIIMISNRQAK